MTQKKRTSIALLCCQIILMAMLLSSTGLALPGLKEEIGLSSVQQGSLVSIQYFGFSIAVLLGGLLFDRFGKLFILRLSFGLIGLSAFLFGWAANYWMAVTGVLLIGAFGSIAQNGITYLSTNYEVRKAEKNNAFVQLFFTVGALLTPIIMLIMLRLFDNWRYAYHIIGICCFIMALATLKYREEKAPAGTSGENSLRVYLTALKKPSYLIAPFALFFYVGAEIGIWGFAPIFFEDQGYGRISGILASILIWVSMFAGRIISVRLLRRYNMMPILLANGVLAVAALTGVIFSGQAAAIVLIGIAGFAFAPFYPLLVTWMTTITGEKSSGALALAMAFGSLGAVLAGWLSGMVVETWGAGYITAIPAVSVLVVIILLFIFRNKKALLPHGL